MRDDDQVVLGSVPEFPLRWVMPLAVRALALRNIVVFVVVNANVDVAVKVNGLTPLSSFLIGLP